MPLGTIILIVVGILIFFGFAHRVLDRMRLSDRAALVFIGLAVIGSFIDVTIYTGAAELVINLGGSLVPVVLAIWLIATADHAGERWRAIAGAVVAGGALYGLGKILPRDPVALPVDPVYLFAVVAGLIAYVLGRSRRGAFTAAILGVTLADLAGWAELLITRTPGRTWLGGAGMLDATVVSGLVAVLVAELVGESLELTAGGPRASRRRNERETGQRGDMTERGSDARGQGSEAREHGSDERGHGARNASALGAGGRGARVRAPASNASTGYGLSAEYSRVQAERGSVASSMAGPRAESGAESRTETERRLDAMRATRGGPGSGDLDRIELEETDSLEGGERRG